MAKSSRPRSTTSAPSLFCVRFFIVLLLVGLGGTFTYLNNYLKELSTALTTESHHVSALQRQVDDQQIIINRFNQSVTNADVQKHLNDLELSLHSTQKELEEELASTESNIQSLLETTVAKLDKTVSEAQAEIQSEVNIVKEDVEQYVRTTQDQFSMENSFMVYQLAGTFTLLACLISMYHMTSHIRFFNQPFVQRKILAILWMSPIYGLTSWLSLVFPKYEGYLSIVKDFYEAYVVYQFLSFLISVLGFGNRDKVVDLLAEHASHLEPPIRFFGWCRGKYKFASDRALANAVLLQCQVFAMQFVFLKPMTAIAMFTCNKLNYFGGGTGPSDYRSPQFWILIVQNISVFTAFSGLIKFYHAAQDNLAWCRPFPKFLCIKGIVFMTFWQGLVISLLASTSAFGKDPSKESEQSDDPDIWGKQAQNFLVCLEMLLFSIAHFYCFPTEEWDPGYRPMMEKKAGVGELAFGDFITDLKLIFSGDLKKTLKTKTLTKSLSLSIDDDKEYLAAMHTSIDENEKSLDKQEYGYSFEHETKRVEDVKDEDGDAAVDLEHQLATSIYKGLDSDDPTIRDAANRVLHSVQGIKDESDDDLKESLYNDDGPDFVHHDGYGSVQRVKLGSPEYETFNPLHSFAKLGSNTKPEEPQGKVKDTDVVTESSGSFLLNPLHNFIMGDSPPTDANAIPSSPFLNHKDDDYTSETTSLLTYRNNDDDSSKTFKNVSLRPSIFTQHDDH